MAERDWMRIAREETQVIDSGRWPCTEHCLVDVKVKHRKGCRWGWVKRDSGTDWC